MPLPRHFQVLFLVLWFAAASCSSQQASNESGAGANTSSGGVTAGGASSSGGASTSSGGVTAGGSSSAGRSSADAGSSGLAPSGPDTSAGGSSGAASGGGGSANENTGGGPGLSVAGSGGVSNGAGGAPQGAAGQSACQNNNTDQTGAANINLATEFQKISGLGGANIIGPGWIADLTADQATTAFGNGDGQIGMSILRIRVPFDETDFPIEVPTAKLAISLGAKVIATPWTPPAALKTNNSTIGGALSATSYDAYAAHLMSFRDFMQTNGAPLYAVSVQNEPDVPPVAYESCAWTADQLLAFVTAEGAKWGSTKLIASESFHFDHAFTDPLLKDATASGLVGIVGGHIYGAGLADYPLARTQGKEVWMTEHYTDSTNSGNAWPSALAVGTEIHQSMAANFSAYIWWYIRRSYGPILEDGTVSKRGYLMAQYAKYVRPGSVRVAASTPTAANVNLTAYKNNGQVIVVAVNTNTTPQTITLNVESGCVGTFAQYTTSETKSLAKGAPVNLTANAGSVTLDAQSVTTFVSQ